MAFEPIMNDFHVEAFSNPVFSQENDESAFIKIEKYNLLFQHLPVKEKVKNIEGNRIRNGYIIHTLTSVDKQEIVKSGRKMIPTYERDIYKENFKIVPFGKIIEKLFALGQKNKDQGRI